MLIIPELKKILIFPPRTASGSLRRAVQDRYPNSMLIYRHMEAAGVPRGYERWPRLGIIRNPIHRIFSLWQFLREIPLHWRRLYPEWVAMQKAAASCNFHSYLLDNETPFATSSGHRFSWPNFTVLYEKPENLKSQREYLIADEGEHAFASTQMMAFEHIDELAKMLDIQLGYHNQSRAPARISAPRYHELKRDAQRHFDRHFQWDIEMWEELTGETLRG